MHIWTKFGVALLLAVGAGGTYGPAQAHPGGTDDQGCHHCRSGCEDWDLEADEYHCHGSEKHEESTDEEASSEDEAASSDQSSSDEVDLEESERVRVVEVLDGDTLVVRTAGRKIRIRLLGIDCPESHVNPKCRRQGREGGPDCEEQIPRGKEATERAKSLVAGKSVRLESEDGDGDFERGGYDRLLAYVRTENGRDFGRVLISEGLCYDYGDTYPHPRHEAYERAEQRAEERAGE